MGYGNASYFALAEIIRKVAGRPWDDYLSEKVFKPSGMKATRTTTTTDEVPNRAQGYTDHDMLHDSADWPAVRPSGAFLSTVWTWPGGTRRCIPTRFSPSRPGDRCGRRSP